MTPNCNRPEVPVSFCATLYGYLIPRHRIDADLAAEEQQVLVTHIEIENSGIFQEKLALLRNKNGKRSQIELLLVDIRGGKIGIPREVQNNVRANSILDIQAAGERKCWILSRLLVVLQQPVGFYDEEPPTSDVGDAGELTSLRDFCDSEGFDGTLPKCLLRSFCE